jgi:hypothetical protein
LKADTVGRRRIRSFDVAPGQSITRSEISLVSLLQNNEVLSKLLNSKNSSDRALAAKLLKMAACIQQVTGGHGSYAPVGGN